MNKFLFLVFLLAPIIAFSQDHRTDVAAINSLEDAQLYADRFREVNVVFFHENLDNKAYLDMKDTLKVGDQFKMQFYNVRVVELGSKKLYNCRYIFINEQNLTDGEAQRNQDEIINQIKSGKSFEEVHKVYSMDNNSNGGDLGWVDPDHMAAGIRDGLSSHKSGDVFKCSDDTLGWHYVVEIIEKPKKVDGHFVLVYPETVSFEGDENIDHEANLRMLSTDEEVRDYSMKHDGVNLHLFNEVNDLQFFWNVKQLQESAATIVGNKMDIDGMRYVVLKDTTVKLYTFQYIFIDGNSVSSEERKRRVNDIYDRYNGGESFESLVNAYWTGNKEYSTMSNIDGALLMPELVAQLDAKKPKELFVARASQSYFVGVPIEATKVVQAYLAISYPIMTE